MIQESMINYLQYRGLNPNNASQFCCHRATYGLRFSGSLAVGEAGLNA